MKKLILIFLITLFSQTSIGYETYCDTLTAKEKKRFDFCLVQERQSGTALSGAAATSYTVDTSDYYRDTLIDGNKAYNNGNLDQALFFWKICANKKNPSQYQAACRKNIAEVIRVDNAKKAAKAKRIADAKKAKAKRIADAKKAEAKKIADAKKANAKKAEERRKIAEAKRVAEEKRKAADAKKASEKRKAADAKKASEKRKAADAKKAEAKRKATAEAKRKATAKAKRIAELKKIIDEKKRIAEEKRKIAEAKRVAEEKRLAEEKRFAEEEFNRKLALIPPETALKKAQNFLSDVQVFVESNPNEYDIIEITMFFINTKPISEGVLNDELLNTIESFREFVKTSNAFIDFEEKQQYARNKIGIAGVDKLISDINSELSKVDQHINKLTIYLAENLSSLSTDLIPSILEKITVLETIKNENSFISKKEELKALKKLNHEISNFIFKNNMATQ